MSKCGPGRGSRQAVQVGGTFVVEGGIDEINESMKVIISCPKSSGSGRWLVDGGW